MNDLESLLMYRDLSAQVYGLWRKAVIDKDREAKAEIRRLLSSNLKHFIITEYPTTGYRARIVRPEKMKNLVITERNNWFSGPSGIHGFLGSEMGAPTKNASCGRANKKNKPVLYLASDVQTACAEVQPSFENLISVALFSIQKGLRIVDFREIPVVYQTFTEADTSEKVINSVFCSSIIEIFRMPVSRLEPDLYKYGQFLSGRLRAHRIDGILYQSSHNQNDSAYNFVLFNPQNANCENEYGDLYKCLSIKTTFQNISVNSSKKSFQPLEAGRSREPVLWNENLMLLQNLKAQRGLSEEK